MGRDPRGEFFTPFRSEMLAMLENPELSHFEARFIGWLVTAVDPGTCRLDGVTSTSLAEQFGVGRKTMQAALEKLRKVGYIDYRFERRTTGWVKVVVYDQVVYWTSRTAEKRRRAVIKEAQANRVEPTRQRANSASNERDSAGKTPEAFLTLLDVTHAEPEPVARRTKGTDEGGDARWSSAS